MTYHYTAILEDESVLFAEHFADEAEAQKRARQFASAIVGNEALTLYVGEVPPERYIARTKFRPFDPTGTETASDYVKALEEFVGNVNTVSLLTPPEVDDSDEARPLPDWAIAQHEVESAGQVVLEARASVEAHKARHLKAYNANDRHAEADARRGLDQAEANLYRAENHIADKVAAYEAKKPKEGKKNA